MRWAFLSTMALWGLVVAGCGEAKLVPVEAVLEVQPRSIDFGPTPLGWVRTVPLQVSNRGEGALTWSASTVPERLGLSVDVRQGEVRPGERTTLTLSLLPGSTGPQSGVLRLLSNSRSQPELLVPVSATVLPHVLTALPAQLDFGPVRTQSEALRSVVVHNYGDQDLDLKLGLEGRQDGLSLLGAADRRVPARGEVTIQLRYAPQFNGRVNASLRIDGQCNLGCTLLVPIAAQGVPSSVVCSPSAVSFGYTNLDTCAYRSLSCVNVDSGPVTVVDSTLDPQSPVFSADLPLLPAVLDSGETLNLDLTHCPQDSVRDEALLTLATAERDAQARYTTVTVVGQGGGPDIAVGSSLVCFGPVVQGAQRHRNLRVDNHGDTALTLSAAEFQPAGPSFYWLGAGPRTIAPGASVNLDLVYAPTGLGPERAQLTLLSDDPDQPQTLVSLEAEGLAPGLCSARLVPGAYSFGLVDVGGSSEATLELFAEDAPCRWADPRVEGDAAFTLVSPPARSGLLARGEVLPFRVRYASQTASPPSGHLSAFFIDVPHATPDTMQVPLTGQAIDNDLIVWPEAIDYGTRPANHDHSRSVYIFNTGASPRSLSDFVLEGGPRDLRLRTLTQPITLRANESVRVQLDWSPTAQSRLQTTLSFRSDALPAVRVQVRGQAAEPNVPACGHLQGSACVPTDAWPAVGAQVSVQSPMGAQASTETDEDGRFFLNCLPTGATTVQVRRGHYTRQHQVTIQPNEVTELPTGCLQPPAASQVAVVTGLYDQVYNLLDGISVNYVVHAGLQSTPPLLTDLDLLLSYDVVLLACGFWDELARDPQVAANLRAFVMQGGSLYVSDLAYDALEAAFPEALDFAGDDEQAHAAQASWGAPIVMPARVLRPDLMRVAGTSSLELTLDLPYVRVQDTAPSASVAVAAATEGPTAGLKPLAVVYQPSGTSGTVVYTTVHEAAQLAPEVRRILMDLLFSL